MATDPEGEREYVPPDDGFRERFWFNVCRYSEYFYLLLVLVTVLGTLNVLAVIVGPQSTGAAVVSAMTFVVLAGTWLGTAFVLWRCKQLRTPDDEDGDAPDARRDLVDT